jgi:2-dehydro-3-deoxyglucarate aldolase
MARSGLDFVTLDVEHGLVDLQPGAAVIDAVRVAGSVPLVRLAGNQYSDNKRWLDAGAEGLIAPLVMDADQARELVESAKYPPEGRRGVGYCHANDYGLDFDAYIRRANDSVLVCVQIEHIRAIENLEAILDVPGIDAAFIGPYDLSASMGLTGQFNHPEYTGALDRFLAVCRAKRVAPGRHIVQPDPQALTHAIEEGYQLIGYSLDVTMLAAMCRSGVQTFRDLVARRPVPGASAPGAPGRVLPITPERP